MLWIKAFHIIFVVTWFAGLFYLPRLFVYHTELAPTDPHYKRLCLMERKLFWGIMTPSALVTIGLGLALLPYFSGALSTGWLHTKISLVVLLVIYHVSCWHFMKKFQQGHNRKSHVFFRFYNEVPAVALVAIVLLVVLKPF